MGDRAGDLIESNLIGNLSAQASGDFSWVKPGKVAWDWWSGPTIGEHNEEVYGGLGIGKQELDELSGKGIL